MKKIKIKDTTNEMSTTGTGASFTSGKGAQYASPKSFRIIRKDKKEGINSPFDTPSPSIPNRPSKAIDYKQLFQEMSKTASPEEAAKELKRQPGEPFKVGQVSFSDDGTTKSTITNINPETGAVKWTITQLPGYDKLFGELDDLTDTAKRTAQKSKDDRKFKDFYEEIRMIRNKVRTHLRKEHPEIYDRIQMRMAEGINEAIDLDIDDEFQMATLSGKSGKYTGYVDDGVVSFSVSYEDREDKIDDFYNESNIDEFIGKDHAFMELAKKYNHKWDIGPDYVEIEIDLKSPLNEAIDLVHVYDKDGKIFGTGEIEQELPNDKVKVRFDGNFVGTFRADRVKPVMEVTIGGSSRERLTSLAQSIGREEFAMNVLEIPDDNVLDDLVDQLAKLYDMRPMNENIPPSRDDKIMKDLAKADDVINIIKMMNPDVREDLLKRLAKMGRGELNEARYSQFKKTTEVRTPTEQIHRAVREIRRKIDEISKVVGHTERMKNELKQSNEGMHYLKRTRNAINKISEKIQELNNRIKGLTE